jgi:hypothetical protein
MDVMCPFHKQFKEEQCRFLKKKRLAFIPVTFELFEVAYCLVGKHVASHTSYKYIF